MRRDDENLELPEGLRGELRGIYEPALRFPDARDGEILRRAMRGRRGWRMRRWAISGAVAAAAVIAVGGMWVLQGKRAERGVVYVRTGDVRDAFYLARELKGHRAPAAAVWDANHDGVVNEKDVRVVAMAAVQVVGDGLEGGER